MTAMSSREGGGQGGAWGVGEDSPGASPAKLPGLTSENSGQGGNPEDHLKREKGGFPGLLGEATAPPCAKIGTGRAGADGITFLGPCGLPSLTAPGLRELLGILVELSTVEILDGPSEEDFR